MTTELTIANSLQINVGRMSDEEYDLLPDFYKNYVKACKESNSSNFRKFKNNETGEQFLEDTDKNLRKYGDLYSDRTADIRNSIYETFNDFFVDPKVEFHFEMMVTEMVTNSFHHGNSNDPRKNLFIEAKIVEEDKDSYLEFSVMDEGDGFDPEAVKDLVEDPELSFGKGIIMTRHFSIDGNSLIYEDGGRKVTFKLARFS